MTKPEALPIVAWLYKSEDGSGFARVHLSYLDARADALAGGSIADLTDHAQATAQLAALQAEADAAKERLAYFGSLAQAEAQKLSEQVAALQAEVERLRPLAERYECIRQAGNLLKLYVYDDEDEDDATLSPGDWLYKPKPEEVDAFADAALLARKGE